MKFKYLIMLLFSLLLGGCGRTVYNVTVDSISSSTAFEKNKFVLIPGNENCEETNLQYLEFATYTENTLENIGFVKASCRDEANVAILLTYGISDPNFYEYTYSIPVWGQTGISASNTYGNLNTYNNGATYSQNTTYTPQYGIIGSTTHKGIGVTYFRHLALCGFDLEKYRDTGKAQELWLTKATSSGESGDLREVFPYLLGASKRYIATNTKKKINMQLLENDKTVQEIKAEISPINRCQF